MKWGPKYWNIISSAKNLGVVIQFLKDFFKVGVSHGLIILLVTYVSKNIFKTYTINEKQWAADKIAVVVNIAPPQLWENIPSPVVLLKATAKGYWSMVVRDPPTILIAVSCIDTLSENINV